MFNLFPALELTLRYFLLNIDYRITYYRAAWRSLGQGGGLPLVPDTPVWLQLYGAPALPPLQPHSHCYRSAKYTNKNNQVSCQGLSGLKLCPHFAFFRSTIACLIVQWGTPWLRWDIPLLNEKRLSVDCGHSLTTLSCIERFGFEFWHKQFYIFFCSSAGARQGFVVQWVTGRSHTKKFIFPCLQHRGKVFLVMCVMTHQDSTQNKKLDEFSRNMSHVTIRLFPYSRTPFFIWNQIFPAEIMEAYFKYFWRKITQKVFCQLEEMRN